MATLMRVVFDNVTTSMDGIMRTRLSGNLLLCAKFVFAAAGLALYLFVGGVVLSEFELENEQIAAQSWWGNHTRLMSTFKKGLQLEWSNRTSSAAREGSFLEQQWQNCGFNLTGSAPSNETFSESELRSKIETFFELLNSMGTCSPPPSCAQELNWQVGPAMLYAFTAVTA